MWWTALFFCILFLSVVALCDPDVKTTKGVVRGKTLKSRDGRDYYSFTGIPYAKPPIGELRFMPPEPVDTWNGILDGTKEANMCIQVNYYLPSLRHLVQGDEDCLYLNVYTSSLKSKLPVMVWIHGGGFYTGHSGSSLYGPEYFMDNDVVIVSFNYRLGFFAFASTEDDVIPGNYGMKDQVAALRWVRENIATFGGDNEQVTIFGESAGGASGGYHMLSPMSKGLFHKVIIQSGSPTCYWALSVPGEPRKRTEAIATIAGCYDDNSKGLLNCLKKLPATFLVKLSNRFFEWNNYPSLPFHIAIETCDSKQDAFLCNHPITDFKLESIVPIMVGINSGEGGLFVSEIYNSTSLKYPELNTNFNRMVASLLEYTHLSLPEDIDEIGNKIKKKYFPSGIVDDNSHFNTVDMITDCSFVSCVLDIPLKSLSPTYFYLFDYQNEVSFNNLFGDCNKSLGVGHCDELISLFKINPLIGQRGLNQEDSKVSKLMVDIWTRFASSELPTTEGTNNGVPWPTFTTIDDSFILHIDSIKPKIIKNPYAEKYRFWKSLPILSRLNKLTSSKSSDIKNEL